MPQKSFRIVRVRPYSCEEGCIVYVDIPDSIWNAAEPGAKDKNRIYTAAKVLTVVEDFFPAAVPTAS